MGTNPSVGTLLPGLARVSSVGRGRYGWKGSIAEVVFGGIALLLVGGVGWAADVPVARMGDRDIPVSALRAAVARTGLPVDQAETVRAAVRQLVEDEALAIEARRQGLDQDPEVVETVQRLMVQKLLAREVDAVVTGRPATEQELKDFHARNAARYATPAMARGQVATLLIRTNRAAVLAFAAQAVGTARTNRFEEVVKRYSDFAQERIGGGETGWLVEGSPSKKYPSEIVKALLAIPQVGGLAEPVVTDRAVYVVRLGEKRAGGTPSFEAVRPQVERDWLTARRQEVHDAFVERVRQSVPVKLDEAVVQQVIQENQSNARPPAAPFRGGR